MNKRIYPRHLRPHATFGDDPSGWCACAECEPRDDCACWLCLETADSDEPDWVYGGWK